MVGLTVIHTSQTGLAAITVVLALACIGGAVFARTRVPAVSVALTVGVATAVLTFLITSREGSRGVPLVVLLAASIGLVLSGLIALPFLRAQTPARTLRRTAAVLVASAPVFGLLALASIQNACPLYVGRGSGFCYYEDDVLGGWSAAVSLIICLDVLAIAFLVWLSARRSGADIEAAEEFVHAV